MSTPPTVHAPRPRRRADADHRQRHVRLGQVGRAQHARGPRATTASTTCRRNCCREFVQQRDARREPRRRNSRSASTCAAGGDLAQHARMCCRRSARSGSIRSCCSSTPATTCCCGAMPTRAAAIRSATSAWRWPTRSRSNARRCKPLRQIADVVLDTSDLNVHQLRRLVITEFGLGDDAGAVAAVRILRLPPRRAAAMRTSCSTRAACPTRTGTRACARCRAATRPCASTSKRSRTCAQYVAQVDAFLDTWLPRLQVGHAQLRHGRLRLHRRPPSLGVPGRAPGARTAASRAGRRLRCTIASWTEPLAGQRLTADASGRHPALLSCSHVRRHPAHHPRRHRLALLAVATRLLRQLPLRTEAFEVRSTRDPDALLPLASAALRRVDGGRACWC